MNEKSAHPPGQYANSFNCVDVYIDEPGDTTVRPCDPGMLEFMKAERAKLQAAQEQLAATEAKQKG